MYEIRINGEVKANIEATDENDAVGNWKDMRGMVKNGMDAFTINIEGCNEFKINQIKEYLSWLTFKIEPYINEDKISLHFDGVSAYIERPIPWSKEKKNRYEISWASFGALSVKKAKYFKDDLEAMIEIVEAIKMINGDN